MYHRKPKNARVKRALAAREPQVVENEKTAIFVRGQSTSEIVRNVMKDLYALKQPHAINFSRKNDIHPFEDTSSLEFFANKNDASLFVTGLHSKKRPHNLVFTRMFDGRVLDMMELGVEGFKSMGEFDSPKSSVGIRPLMVFHSDLFDTHPKYQLVKSFLLDFYNGHALSEIPLIGGLEHVISITAGPLPQTEGLDLENDKNLPKIHLRVYTVKLLASGSKIPKTQLTEMGPSIDFSLRRVQDADEEMLKMSMKRPKLAKSDVESGLGKKKKNIETDSMGDKVGKLHLDRQDLSKMQGRKMKGLKVRKVPAASDGEMQVDNDEE
uniref:Ribosome production factor 2 homolog n=1 Tax=Kwoniella bestiolae CBS 10118 TaxID=1296100 RepID=A0A1B9GCF9_9TREE|nr:ribosome production factor 2 [Kwoniella bestiolae CBS 10118]OCF28712.1 ribosome production factor 2 [Kwoniella bestiolae CBS 10118]